MKNVNIKYLLIGYICCLLFPLQSCNDVDDLQAQANLLKERVTALETAVGQMNESVNSLQYLLSGTSVVGVTAIDKGYKIELADGQSFNIVSGEKVDGLLPLMKISDEGHWMYSVDGTNYIRMIDKDGKPLFAYPANSEGNPIKSPQMRISADGYWQVSYDGGSTFDFLMSGGNKVSALSSISLGDNSIFSKIAYDNEKQEIVLTMKADGRQFSFPVVDTFYLKVIGAENEQVFPLGEMRKYVVEQSEVDEAVIQAPEGWKVVLSETELSITSPDATDAEKHEKINLIITSPKKYIRMVTVEVKLLTTKYAAGTSRVWKDYVGNSADNVLLDFSFAGYKHGEVAPPDVSTLGYKEYNIMSYGAIPNDGKSDREAFIKLLEAMGAKRGADADAIRYQMNSAKAVIYFPEGEFVLQGEGENNMPLRLTMNDLVIKGAGRDKTTIKMEAQNEPARPNEMWSAPVMLELKNNSGLTDLTDVTADAAKGTFSVEVGATAGIKAGDWVCLSLVNNDPALIAQELAPHAATSGMTNLNETGVQVYDYHQVKSVSGTTVTFKEPLMHGVETQWGWKIKKYPHYENIGVEDLTFEGNAKPDFAHHASAADDGAYKPIDLVRLTNSWMRRVGFVSVSEASSITNCANVSVYDVTISGNRGHSAIRSQASSRVFIGKVVDESNGYEAITSSGSIGSDVIDGVGQYHACGVSKQSIGAVIWNVHWGLDACFESHATQPRATLIDRCEGGFMPWRQGGDNNQMPNHLDDLIIWNMKATKVKYDNSWGNKFIWWDADNLWWKNLPPVIVGFHGASITFDETPGQMKRIESNGTAVEPYSLYEAQLRQRLGYVPAWLNSLK